MTVSFDLDGTIIMPAEGVDLDESFASVFGCSRKLRAGTIPLFQRLVEQSIELVIYTNSYRSRMAIKQWFGDKGVELSDVITQPLHEQAAEQFWAGEGMPPIKCPPWFGIDLHIDDSTVVAHEAEEMGFRVLLVSPDDEDWDERVVKGICGMIN